jgi:hypothetical protein
MTDPIDPAAPTEPTETKAFTAPASQEELDRIITDRLARERAKYADYDDLKTKAQQHDALLESQKSDADKAIDEARKSASGEVTQKFLTRLVSTETKSIAATLGFIDPADALAVLGDELPVKDDDADTDEITRRVKELAEKKPYLVGGDSSRKPRTRPKPDPGNPQEDPAPKKGRAAAALRTLGATRGN